MYHIRPPEPMEESKAMLRKLLPVDYQSVILSASTKPERDGAVFGCIGLPIFTQEEAVIWLGLFERKTFTTYSSKDTWRSEKGSRCFKRTFTCSHVNTNKSTELACQASVEFTIKDTKESMTNSDYYLRDHPTQVTIQSCHNHKVGIDNELPSKSLKLIFGAYFNKGHSPLSALFCHKCDLHSFYGSDFYNVISHEDICPSLNWCYQEYENVFKHRYVKPPECELLQELKNSVEKYNARYAENCAVFTDNHYVLSICTPLMKQVFNSGFADDLIIVRILSSAKNGQKCPNIVLFLSLTPIGPMPFGIVLTFILNKTLIYEGIRTLFRTLGSVSYNPKTIIVDQCYVITDGLKKIFPLSEIVFNKFQILQSAWRILRLAHEGNSQEFQAIYKYFLDTLNSKSAKEFEYNADMLCKYAEKYPKMYDFVQFFQTRSKSNAFPRSEFTGDVMNYMDCGALMLQDVCIKYSNIFNILQTFDFVTENYINHYERKLVKIVQGDLQGFFKTNFYAPPSEIDNFTCRQISHCEFLVKSLNNRFFINHELNSCTCQVIEYGRSCIHQYIVEQHIGFIPETYRLFDCNLLHTIQTMLSYKVKYQLHILFQNVGNDICDDSAAFKKLENVSKHDDNENDKNDNSWTSLAESFDKYQIKPKSKAILYHSEPAASQAQTFVVDLTKSDDERENVEATSIKRGGNTMYTLPSDCDDMENNVEELGQLTTSNKIKTKESFDELSSCISDQFRAKNNVREGSHDRTNPKKQQKGYKHMKIFSSINSPDIKSTEDRVHLGINYSDSDSDQEHLYEYSISTTKNRTEKVHHKISQICLTHKPSCKKRSKPNSYKHNKGTKSNIFRNSYQDALEDFRGVKKLPLSCKNTPVCDELSGQQLKELNNKVRSSEMYQPKMFTCASDHSEQVMMQNGIINFESTNKSTQFDPTTNTKQILTMDDPELSFLFNNPRIEIVIDLNNSVSEEETPIADSLNTYKDVSIIDLTLDESDEQATKPREKQIKHKRSLSLSSDSSEQESVKMLRPRILKGTSRKAATKLEEVGLENNFEISGKYNEHTLKHATVKGPRGMPRKISESSEEPYVQSKFEMSVNYNTPKFLQTPVKRPRGRPRKKRSDESDLESESKMSINYNKIKFMQTPVKRPRGRPRKKRSDESDLESESKMSINYNKIKFMQTPVKRPRGRPRKKRSDESDLESESKMSVNYNKIKFMQRPVKRPRGRPRKKRSDESDLESESKMSVNYNKIKFLQTAVNRPRGRPRKKPQSSDESDLKSESNMSVNFEKIDEKLEVSQIISPRTSRDENRLRSSMGDSSYRKEQLPTSNKPGISITAPKRPRGRPRKVCTQNDSNLSPSNTIGDEKNLDSSSPSSSKRSRIKPGKVTEQVQISSSRLLTDRQAPFSIQSQKNVEIYKFRDNQCTRFLAAKPKMPEVSASDIPVGGKVLYIPLKRWTMKNLEFRNDENCEVSPRSINYSEDHNALKENWRTSLIDLQQMMQCNNAVQIVEESESDDSEILAISRL